MKRRNLSVLSPKRFRLGLRDNARTTIIEYLGRPLVDTRLHAYHLQDDSRYKSPQCSPAMMALLLIMIV